MLLVQLDVLQGGEPRIDPPVGSQPHSASFRFWPQLPHSPWQSSRQTACIGSASNTCSRTMGSRSIVLSVEEFLVRAVEVEGPAASRTARRPPSPHRRRTASPGDQVQGEADGHPEVHVGQAAPAGGAGRPPRSTRAGARRSRSSGASRAASAGPSGRKPVSLTSARAWVRKLWARGLVEGESPLAESARLGRPWGNRAGRKPSRKKRARTLMGPYPLSTTGGRRQGRHRLRHQSVTGPVGARLVQASSRVESLPLPGGRPPRVTHPDRRGRARPRQPAHLQPVGRRLRDRRPPTAGQPRSAGPRRSSRTWCCWTSCCRTCRAARCCGSSRRTRTLRRTAVVMVTAKGQESGPRPGPGDGRGRLRREALQRPRADRSA